MVAKLHRHLQSFHQRELRVSNLRRLNLEIEELEGSKEIATTERDLRIFDSKLDKRMFSGPYLNLKNGSLNPRRV